MNENRRASTHPELHKPSARTKLTETYHKQKSVTTANNKRKVILSEQTASTLNQSQAHTGGAEKDAGKKPTKVEIPVSLDIDPFSGETYADPQNAMDKMLHAKGGDELKSPEPAKRVSLGLNEAEAQALRALVKKSETDLLTLKHQLLETKAELKAAEDRLREKDAIIREQELRIDELIETRVPMDDMNDIMAENERLQKELKENESLLAECQKLLEEYVANEN
ncbi:hypothetical protein GGI07_002672 [Coemansia sp. Benny D115]|nr:hypothetical protein GGI07_002672 [Coemansia sp. Benny D115]